MAKDVRTGGRDQKQDFKRLKDEQKRQWSEHAQQWQGQGERLSGEWRRIWAEVWSTVRRGAREPGGPRQRAG